MLALVCVIGAALRFATLDVQSLWFDEAVTAQLMRLDLPDLLHAIPGSESSPPLYYLLEWLWTQLFGTGEVGLRSLSALIGTVTIPAVWALGRRLGGNGAGLVAAALLAVNPMLVWFSQEARAYALLALLGALAALLWLRALELPTSSRLLAWGLVAALAMATHYYAIFLVGPQALWLVYRAPTARGRAIALALPVAAALVLAPLALEQRANDSAAFISNSALATRLTQVPKQFLLGYNSPLETLLALVSVAALGLAIGGLLLLVLRRVEVGEAARAGTLRLLAIAAAALVLPVLAAAAGEDHVITRNVLAVLPLAAALAGAGIAALGQAAPRAARAAAAAMCVVGVVGTVGVAADPALQRDDWRGAARALGSAGAPRVIAATPPASLVPLRYYLPGLRAQGDPQVTTAEVDYLALSAG
ncbi:MAG TPA: glycosyltransferase family 39 protein, partial [Solirubrobacteraceae bacterium]